MVACYKLGANSESDTGDRHEFKKRETGPVGGEPGYE